LSDEELFRESQQVLAEWPTGKDIDLDEVMDTNRCLSSGETKYIVTVLASRF